MIELFIILIIIGAMLYIIQLLPIDGTVKQIIYVLAILMVLIYLLEHLAAFRL